MHYSCGFRLIGFTAQNVTAPDLPILGSFCKHLRKFVTKTFQSCSRWVPVMGGLQGGLDFFDLWLCYLQDWLFDFWVKSFCEKVWLSWVHYVKFGLFLLSRLKFWLIRNETFYGIWLLDPLMMLSCDLWLLCKRERIINKTSIDCAKDPRHNRLKTKLTILKIVNDFRWLTID